MFVMTLQKYLKKGSEQSQKKPNFLKKTRVPYNKSKKLAGNKDISKNGNAEDYSPQLPRSRLR